MKPAFSIAPRPTNHHAEWRRHCRTYPHPVLRETDEHLFSESKP